MTLRETTSRERGFTCASGWNDHLRASRTMRNPSIITNAGEQHSPTLLQRDIPPNPMPQLAYPALRALFYACIALHLTTYPNSSWSNGRKSHTSTEAAPSKRKGVNKVIYQRSSSEETPAQHDKRMYRECKGMHNAGACRGYTRK